MRNKFWISGGLCACLLTAFSAPAMLHTPDAFGDRYQPALPVVEQLTQIVYYRAKSADSSRAPANVYVDGRYHTSLLPGGFTSFCLRPGQHTLGAFVNDPLYKGKTEERFATNLPGGSTFFLRVNEQQQVGQPPLAVQRLPGEKEANQTHRQIHARSRATTVVPCVFDRAAVQSESRYLFSERTLLKQDRGVVELSNEGMQRLNELVVTLRQQHPLLRNVVIRLESRGEPAQQQRSKAKAIATALSLAAIPSEVISSQFVRCEDNCSVENQQVQILVR